MHIRGSRRGEARRLRLPALALLALTLGLAAAAEATPAQAKGGLPQIPTGGGGNGGNNDRSVGTAQVGPTTVTGGTPGGRGSSGGGGSGGGGGGSGGGGGGGHGPGIGVPRAGGTTPSTPAAGTAHTTRPAFTPKTRGRSHGPARSTTPASAAGTAAGSGSTAGGTSAPEKGGGTFPSGTLPFTGLALSIALLAALGLLGAGTLVRRASTAG